MPHVYSCEQIENAKKICNGIKAAVSNPGFGWREGWRNTMAVDLSCALWVLNHRDYEEQSKWITENLELSASDWDDCTDRLIIIEKYLDNWDSNPHGVFDKMIDPGEWIEWDDNTED